MARRLHKGRILRIGHFIAIDKKLVEVDLSFRLLIEPTSVCPEHKRSRRDDNKLFRQRVFRRSPSDPVSITLHQNVLMSPQMESIWSREEWR